MGKNHVYTFAECNATKFVWINTELEYYPKGTKEYQYSKFLVVSLISYLDQIRVQEFCDYLLENGFTHYVYIRHADHNDTDNPHFHILCYCPNTCLVRKPLDLMVKFARFRKDAEYLNVHTMAQQINCGVENVVEYLTHTSHTCKTNGRVTYSINDCVSDNMQFWLDFQDKYEGKSVGKKGGTDIQSLFRDIGSGMNMYRLACKYGRDFVLNYDKYLRFYHEFVRNSDDYVDTLDEMVQFQERSNKIENKHKAALVKVDNIGE